MGGRPGLSVVIPTHMGRESVKRAVASLLAAGYPKLQILVVCDGSSEETERVLAEVSDPRVTVLEIQKQGVSAARNHGLRSARYEWVAFVDDDDVPRDNWLESWVSGTESGADFISGTAVRHVADHDPEIRHCTLDPGDPTMGASALLAGTFWSRRHLLLAVNGYDCGLRFAENQDLGLRLCDHFRSLTPPPRILHNSEPVLDVFVQESGARGTRYGAAQADSARLLLSRYPGRMREDPKYKASLFRIIAKDERLRRRHGQAIKTAILAVRTDPSNLFNHRSLLLALLNPLISCVQPDFDHLVRGSSAVDADEDLGEVGG